MHKANLFIAVIGICFAGAILGGCQSKTASGPETDSGDLSQSDPVASPPATDIATQSDTLPDKDASAREVCVCFSRLLQQQQRTLAEQLLTSKAISAAVDSGLELQPLGSKDAEISIGKAAYATNRARIAQVPCTVVEKDGSQQTVSWMLRKGKKGWRISGLVVDSDSNSDLINLENKADVASIVGTAEPEIRRVSATDDE